MELRRDEMLIDVTVVTFGSCVLTGTVTHLGGRKARQVYMTRFFIFDSW